MSVLDNPPRWTALQFLAFETASGIYAHLSSFVGRNCV